MSTDRAPVDPFGVPDTFTDMLVDIEHTGGMVRLTFFVPGAPIPMALWCLAFS
jgi:hypothetical protein